MTQEKTKETFNQIVEQGKDIVEKGNQRHIVIRDADGKKLADLSFTVVTVIAVVLLFAQPVGWLIAIAATIYGIARKLKLEILRDITDEDNVVEVNLPHEEA